MTETAIRVEQLGKEYRIGASKEEYRTLRDTIADAVNAPIRVIRSLSGHGYHQRDDIAFWALRDISFDIERGSVVGVIGRNGAGKSTLLRILSRITDPTEGYADVFGRVGSLLEVGTGFHPELTGRDNIYLNGAILGMKRSYIQRHFDAIVEFAEVEKFIDTPVKHYSSGMYLRLAFAVAAHLEPDILVVDEVLAVGDHAFQKKCMGKMDDVAKQGRTVLFVSHNIGAIAALCDSGIWLESGRMVMHDKIAPGVDAYLASLTTASSTALRDRHDRGGNGLARFTEAYLATPQQQPLVQAMAGTDCALILRYESQEPLRNPVFKCTIYSYSGHPLTNLDSRLINSFNTTLPASGTVTCRLGPLPLSQGSYRVNISLESDEQLLDHLTSAAVFTVEPGNYYGTGRNVNGLRDVVLVNQEWALLDEIDRPQNVLAK